MNLNRNCLSKKYVDTQNLDFFKKQAVICFIIPNVLEFFGLFSWYNDPNTLRSQFFFGVTIARRLAIAILRTNRY